jgi:hypothetical protein
MHFQHSNFRRKRDVAAVKPPAAEGGPSKKLAESLEKTKLDDKFIFLPLDTFGNALEKFMDEPDYERLSPDVKDLFDEAIVFFCFLFVYYQYFF